ncbi:unnamed protein product, partial [Rotaria sp. Silwood1]
YQHTGLYSIRKRRKWLVDIGLNECIEKENFQWPQHTVQIIVNYGLFLLQRVEYHPNKEQRE